MFLLCQYIVLYVAKQNIHPEMVRYLEEKKKNQSIWVQSSLFNRYSTWTSFVNGWSSLHTNRRQNLDLFCTPVKRYLHIHSHSSLARMFAFLLEPFSWSLLQLKGMLANPSVGFNPATQWNKYRVTRKSHSCNGYSSRRWLMTQVFWCTCVLMADS